MAFDPYYPQPIIFGLNWYDKILKEANEMTTFHTGSLVLVEVHGLPSNKVESFTYEATYPVEIGQQVLVPAPDWSIRVTGRAELPGFVLGDSNDVSSDVQIRSIIPQPAYSSNEGIEKLLSEWEKEVERLRDRSFELNKQAREYEQAADDTMDRIDQLRKAVGA